MKILIPLNRSNLKLRCLNVGNEIFYFENVSEEGLNIEYIESGL